VSKQHIKPAYAKIDPAHLFDGVFVPTSGKPRGRLFVEMRQFKHLKVGFQGFEQLGADDQSILLALTAQLGIDGLVIDDPKGPVTQQLRSSLDFKNDDGAPIASKRTTLRSLLIDAGHNPDTSTEKAKDSLNRLSNVQIREINENTGWDRRCNLVSVSFNHKTGEIYAAANPRLAGAIFRQQHVKISLFERNELKSEVAKIIHCWCCSNIRLGTALGNGNGAHLDTLAPHVWGKEWENYSTQSKSNKRRVFRDALEEIYYSTKDINNGYGWEIDQTSSGLVMISRPKNLPHLEGIQNLRPSEFHAIMTEPPDAEDFSPLENE